MPSWFDILTFHDSSTPPGKSSWVPGTGPQVGGAVVAADPMWPQSYAELGSRIRTVLGWRVLDLDHVGSTSLSGLVAKPIIDIDLTVADPKDESALDAVGFRRCIPELSWCARAEAAP